MIGTASIISWPTVLNTKLVKSMSLACESFDIFLEQIPFVDGQNTFARKHFEILQKHKNSISWVCFYCSEIEQKDKVNLLFFENGLLDRGNSYYLDDNGYGQNSNIVALKENIRKFPEIYVSEVYNKLSKFGWKSLHKISKDKTIMIALQARRNEDIELLSNCEKFLPKKTKVIIRAHPRDKKNNNHEYYIDFINRNKDWEIDNIENPFDSLSRCSAMVVNSSSMIYKALYMGIPVASFTRSFHSGSPSVLDCSRNPEMVSHIFSFKHNQDYAERLICSIDYHSIRSEASVDELLTNTNFVNWLKRFRY